MYQTMPHDKDNLQEAVYNGNISKTKELLESGTAVPEQCLNKNVDSLRLLLTKPRGVGRGIFTKKSDKNSPQLDTKTADSIATMLSQVNNFDEALSEALNGGFMKSKIIDIDETKNDTIVTKKQTDMLKGRRKLAALVLNHYASDEDSRLDLLSRFRSLKESIPETHEKKEEWEQTYNLINKHIDLGKELYPAKKADTQEQGVANDFPISSITIIDPKDDISLSYSTDSSMSFASTIAKDQKRVASKVSSFINELAEVVGEPRKPLQSILRKSESSSSNER